MRWMFVGLLLASCAPGPSPRAGVRVTAARAELNAAGNGVVFLTVQNLSTRGETLVSAESPAAYGITLHDVQQLGEVLIMTDQPQGYPIRAGETAVLAPGGKHLMLAGVALAASAEHLPLILHFLHAGPIEIQADVHHGRASQ